MTRHFAVPCAISLTALVVSLFWVLLLTKSQEESSVNDARIETVKFESANNEGASDWKNSKAIYKGEIIPDKASAVEVASSILFHLYDQELRGKYIPERVTFSEDEDIWIVYFKAVSTDSRYEMLGGGYYVVLQKSDGKVLSICRPE